MTATLEGLQALSSLQGFEHYANPALRKSAKRGCSMCTFLSTYRMVVRSTRALRLTAITGAETKQCDSSNPQQDHPFLKTRFQQIKILCSDPTSMYQDLDVEIFTTTDDLAAAHLNLKSPFRPMATKEIFEKINNRLNRCCQTHQACHFEDRPILQHRVLCVGSDNPSAMIKLHVRKKRERQRYTALSYCWGGTQDFLLTTKNIGLLIQGFHLEALPPTIRDAVIVTRNLGIRYLWVDALCIMQDSSDDKSAEIASMGKIYKHATITIAAGSATSSKEGFLEDRSIHPESEICRVPLYLSPNLWGTMWVGNESGDVSTNDEPLELRAWTLQESLLSPRLLFYGSKKIIWKCQTEAYQSLEETTFYYSPDAGRLPPSIFEPSWQKSVITIPNQSKLWKSIIENYSRRKLSLFEDRLPALGGVASELSKVWHDAYVVGMWRRCLIHHLGWKQMHTHKITTTPQSLAYRSPGWSWVTWPGRIEVTRVHIEDAKVIYYSLKLADDRHPFGKVLEGLLVLRAFLVRAPQCDRDIRYRMDTGPSGKRPLTSNCRLLLLGYTTMESSIALVVTHQDNGQYIRVGQAQVAKKRSDLWPTDASERQLITII